ncbi:nucleoid occlusion protein [Texcoconibacillus texcoconensis]|uniref:ParB family chromosome partitioning protein n=1 Tax=Texcoconibacillus texcoconensis TaxID=1095777 RepID=A0A840QTS4_9BACI|nr:nucleoid occlusion protein [Texcoconibacillus texcoconensis]MBB5174775.1 ParB family chromosome partitioning protein [Texcoconibacillus texcoconensis]
MKHSFSRILGLNDKEEKVEASEKDEVKDLPVADIIPNRFQPRTIFQDERIEELAQTIKTHGMIQPIVVREQEDGYELIAGERRWRAVQLLGWETVPAVVREFNDSQTASVALIENLQREGLTAIEEATAYQRLLELHGLTQESLAQRLGKGQSTIANKLRLLHLPQSVQDALLNRTITERHARALIALETLEEQEAVLKKVIEQELNVKQTEAQVAKMKEKKEPKPKPVRKSVSKDTRLALNTIRQSVDMVMKTGMDIDTDEEDHEDYVQFTIRVPKK